MTNVKRTFFLTKEECKRIGEETGDEYISPELPHYELDDGTLMYGKQGYSVSMECWWAVLGKK